MSNEPRTLTEHHCRGLFSDVVIRVIREGTEQQGALYEVSKPFRAKIMPSGGGIDRDVVCVIPAQVGEPIACGINGLSEEALLTIVFDMVVCRLMRDVNVKHIKKTNAIAALIRQFKNERVDEIRRKYCEKF